MRSASSAFAAAVQESHRWVSKVEIYSGGDLVDDTYEQRRYFALTGGSIEFARTADTRTTGDITFTVLDASGIDYLEVLSGVEIVPYRGIYINDVPEFVRLGTLVITETQHVRRSDGSVQVTVTVSDRSELIRSLPFNQPYKISSGTDYFAAIKAIVDDRAKTFSPRYNFGSSALTTPDMFIDEDADPWAYCIKLAEAVGCEAYFDDDGSVVAQPVPDPALLPPSAEIVIGQAGVLVTPLTKRASRADVFNGVICKAEAPWLLFPVKGEAWDTDPLSKTYRHGPFGEKPKKIGDALATTDAQCDAIAAAELKKIKGLVENIDFQLLADPRRQVGDIIYFYDPTLRIEGRLMLDTLKISLVSADMSGTIRRQA